MTQGNPSGDPIYPPPSPPPAPYGYPGYRYGYPPPAPPRPSAVTASAVLGFVAAGLLVLAGIMLFSGASALSSLHNVANSARYTAELALDGFLNLLAAGLLIGGGTVMFSRRMHGRALYSVGAAIVVVESIYWIARWGGTVRACVMYALVFGLLVVIGSWLAWTRGARGWLIRR